MLGVVLPFLRARQKSPPSVILYQKRALPAVQAIGLGLGFRGMSLMNAAGRPGFPFALCTLPSPPRLHPALHMHDTHTFRPSPSLAPLSSVMLAAVSMGAVMFEKGREGGFNAGSMRVRASQSKSWVRPSQTNSWGRAYTVSTSGKKPINLLGHLVARRPSPCPPVSQQQDLLSNLP